MKRVSSGVPGLDELIQGGFPEGRSILLVGGPGTGKTILSTQFLYKGALKGEPGIFLTLEERPSNLRREMSLLGMDIPKMEKKGLISIIDASLIRLGQRSDEHFVLAPDKFDIKHIIATIINTSRQTGAVRLVIDALPSLDILLKGDKEKIRNAIIEMNYLFQANDLTTLLLSEATGNSPNNYSIYGVEEYVVVDGIIHLGITTMGGLNERRLTIAKMRETKHTLDPIKMEIGSKGIILETKNRRRR